MAGESAQQTVELEKLRAENHSTTTSDPENNEEWKELVSFEWNDKDVCFLYAHPDDGLEPFGIGTTYLDGEFQAILETPPFSVRITLPYLRAAVKALEAEAHRIPTSRHGSL